jgi:hypothetical protein
VSTQTRRWSPSRPRGPVARASARWRIAPASWPRPRRSRRAPGRAGRHLLLEQPGAPRGLPRGAVHGSGAAHPQHPAVPRAARLRDQPRRGQGGHRRRLAGPAARPGALRAQVRGAHRRGGPRRRVRPRGRTACTATRSSSPGSPPTSPTRSSTSGRRPPCATPAAPPATPRAWPTATAPRDLHSFGVVSARSSRSTRATASSDRADVPRQRLGAALRRLDGGRRLRPSRALPAGRAAVPDHRRGAADGDRRGADHLERGAALRRGQNRRRPSRRSGGCCAAARPCRAR